MSSDPYIGSIFEEKYEILRVIGAGGMSKVYEARHTLINRRFAIKVLHKEYYSDEEIVRRFRREAKACTAIGHGHIVEITDMGSTATGEIFTVMEFLEGITLQELLEKKGRLPVQRACDIMIQVLSALEAAHAQGIVHRDLKPANIFLIERPNAFDYVKIIDFGLSKMLPTDEDLTPGLTRTGTMLGTPSYMSPEQAMAEKDIKPASDLFSCGVIFYEMLTGVLPFNASTISGLFVQIATEKPRDPALINPILPPALGQALRQALAKAPEDRFPDAATFRRAITPFSPDTPITTGLATTQGPERISRPIPEPIPDIPNRGMSVLLSDLINSTVLQATPSYLPLHNRQRRIPIVIGGVAALVAVFHLFAIFIAPVGNLEQGAASPIQANMSAVSGKSSALSPSVKPVSDLLQSAITPAQKVPWATSSQGINFTATIEPENAAVLCDGIKLGEGSFETRLPADGKEHRIVIRAPGYGEHRQKLLFDRDIVFSAKLRPDGRHRGATRRNDSLRNRRSRNRRDAVAR